MEKQKQHCHHHQYHHAGRKSWQKSCLKSVCMFVANAAGAFLLLFVVVWMVFLQRNVCQQEIETWSGVKQVRGKMKRIILMSCRKSLWYGLRMMSSRLRLKTKTTKVQEKLVVCFLY